MPLALRQRIIGAGLSRFVQAKGHTVVEVNRPNRLVYLWRAIDAEGEVPDVLVQTRRNKRVALKLMRKVLKKYGFVPDKLVTDDLVCGHGSQALNSSLG